MSWHLQVNRGNPSLSTNWHRLFLYHFLSMNCIRITNFTYTLRFCSYVLLCNKLLFQPYVPVWFCFDFGGYTLGFILDILLLIDNAFWIFIKTTAHGAYGNHPRWCYTIEEIHKLDIVDLLQGQFMCLISTHSLTLSSKWVHFFHWDSSNDCR